MRRFLLFSMLLAACGSDTSHVARGANADAGSNPPSYAALAGDGSQALRKLAGVWCDRLIPCAAEAELGRLWADRDTCVREQTLALLDEELDVGCDDERDLSIAAEPLARCLQAIGQASCPRIAPTGAPVNDAALFELALVGGQLRDCRDASRAVSRAQDAVYGNVPEGGACNAEARCGELLVCSAERGACGVCNLMPQLGQACYEGADGCYCDLGLEPGPDGLCRSQGGGEGDGCGLCNPGLDCESGVCTAVHHEGESCQTAGDCGQWLHCLTGRCTYKLPYAASTEFVGIGAACDEDSQDNSCALGRCVAGKCVDRGGLGETCTVRDSSQRECQLPYSCIHGVCTAGPACGAGQESDPCETPWQCAVGFGCIAGDDPPSFCGPLHRPASNGESCTADAGCDQGSCVDGACQTRADGAACTQASDCSSHHCEAGACAALRCP